MPELVNHWIKSVLPFHLLLGMVSFALVALSPDQSPGYVNALVYFVTGYLFSVGTTYLILLASGAAPRTLVLWTRIVAALFCAWRLFAAYVDALGG